MSIPSLISPGDPLQALRVRRHLMASGTSALAIGVLVAWHLLGKLERGPFLLLSAVIALWMLAFYWIFRTGLNRKWSDPSLTLPQMGAASLTLLVAIYAADGSRAVFLALQMMVMLFGTLRLRTRALLVYAGGLVIGYVVVIVLLWVFKRQTLDLWLELRQLFVFSVTIPWLALMGGYISGLREALKAALRTVRDSEHMLAQAQRIAHVGSWTFDPATRVAVWSAETYRIFGLDPNQPALVGIEFCSLVHAEDRERYTQLIHKAACEGKEFDTEYRITLPSGAVRWVHALAKPAVDEKGLTTLLRGTVMDITERKAAEEQIRQLAHFDALTGLANRNLLIQLLSHALAKTQRRGTSLAVLFIDLDGFKKVNDTLGHKAGDWVLAEFARRLSRCLRTSDTAARWGGDEFVAVIEGFDSPASIPIIAERVLLAGSTPFQFEGQECLVSASVGVATYPQAGEDIDTLIKNADNAMYCAKHAGRNSYRLWAAEPVLCD